MENKTITVFGGSGFVGRHLVKRLAERGNRIRVAVRDIESAGFLKPAGDVGQIVPVAADICDPSSIAAAVDGADGAVNLVGILYESGRRTFQSVHADGAANVARAAADAGLKRLVHMSAIGADPHSLAEYGRTKAAGEQAVLAAFPGAVILRPSVIFGPEDGLFNMFAGFTRISWFLPVFGTSQPGGTRFQPVFVGDVAEAVIAGLSDSTLDGQTFELGGPTVYSSREIMQLILKETGRKRILFPVPLGLLSMKAFFLEKLPKPLLTRDQVRLLATDNVVSAGAKSLADLGIRPTAAEAILPTYLFRYRPGGRARTRIA